LLLLPEPRARIAASPITAAREVIYTPSA
jgi:hypothetical protein